MFLIAGITFGILCTYYFINVFTNKGVMSNIEFGFALFILTCILAYIYLQGCKETFMQPTEQKKIREKVVEFYHKSSMTAKALYLKHKPAFVRMVKNFSNNHKWT